MSFIFVLRDSSAACLSFLTIFQNSIFCIEHAKAFSLFRLPFFAYCKRLAGLDVFRAVPLFHVAGACSRDNSQCNIPCYSTFSNLFTHSTSNLFDSDRFTSAGNYVDLAEENINKRLLHETVRAGKNCSLNNTSHVSSNSVTSNKGDCGQMMFSFSVSDSSTVVQTNGRRLFVVQDVLITAHSS